MDTSIYTAAEKQALGGEAVNDLLQRLSPTIQQAVKTDLLMSVRNAFAYQAQMKQEEETELKQIAELAALDDIDLW
jgi:hypothetical protein